MFDTFIIDELRRRQREEEWREQPRLEEPVPMLDPDKKQERPSGGTVIKIDILGNEDD